MRASKWVWCGLIAAALSAGGCLQALGLDFEPEGGGGAATTDAGGSSTTTSPTGGGGAAGNGGVAGDGGMGGSGAGGQGGTGGSMMPCSGPEDCPPTGSECQLPTCDAISGRCATESAPAGTILSSQTAGDCKVSVCDDMGGTVVINDDQDVLDDSKDCTVDLCAAGVPSVQPAPPGTACDDDGGKLCDEQASCVACLVDTDCADQTAPKCAAGVCVAAECDDGTKNGTETDVDCGGGACPPCTTGKVCSIADDCENEVCAETCLAPTCDDGVKNGAETAVDCGGVGCSPCGPGADCNVNGDCAGSQCTGMNGTCVPNCQDGEKNNAETDVDCGGDTCQGCTSGQPCAQDTDCQSGLFCGIARVCATKLPTGTTCMGANQCQGGICTDAVCCNVACNGTCQACNLPGSVGSCELIPAGADPANECAGALVCNGLGTCKKPNGDTCGAGSECASALCVDGVCCNGPCNGTCQTCNLAGSAGTCTNIPAGQDPANECPTECNGTGACGNLLGPGTVCLTASQCQDGNCVDGVCCNTACAGPCQACDLAGTMGACTLIPAGTDPANECAGAKVCDGLGACKQPQGSTCAAGSECLSGSCADGICCNTACTGTCQACNLAGLAGTCSSIPNNQDPANECPNGACNGSGVCKLDNGQTCATNGACLSGTCADGLCCNTACTGTCQACNLTGSNGTCTNILSGQDPANECTGSSGADVCNGAGACKKVNSTTCGANSECLSGNCIDGVCCNTTCTGTCQACNVTGLAGTCSNIPNNQDPANECSNGACNGSGACKLDNGQTCAAGSACLSGNCIDGVCCNTTCTGTCKACSVAGSVGTCSNIPSGQDPANECTGNAGADVCNGSGVCKEINGTTCAAGSECLSALCTDGVCCNTTCTGTCVACNISGSAGACTNIPSGQDPANECVGSITCSGMGTCGALLPTSSACSVGNECQSGNCVDGVCCNSTCTGACQACSLAGSTGTCTNIPSGQDPANECTGSSGADVCNGAGACKKVNSSTCGGNSECLSGQCVDGVCCNTSCTGTCQACNIAGSTGTCSNIPSGQDPSNECVASITCTGMGTCGPLLSGGALCSVGNECQSGNCVDGVCCNSSCSGTCQACNIGGSGGTCTNIPSGQDPANECNGNSGADVCNGSGLCKEINGSACTAGSECVSGQCVDGVCCNTSCSGTCQACNIMGSAGTCSNIPSGQDPANECVASITCTGMGTCGALLPNSSTCSVGNECASGSCIDGVCCDTSCTGTCQACNVTGSTGICSNIPYGQDPANECTGSSGADVCNGAGACKKPLGLTCIGSSECLSGNCVDGICCDSSCNGTCQACSAAKTGYIDGICANIVQGTDPDSECLGQQSCNGSGGCQLCTPFSIKSCTYPAPGPTCPGICFAANEESLMPEYGDCNPTIQSCLLPEEDPAINCPGEQECLPDGSGWGICLNCPP